MAAKSLWCGITKLGVQSITTMRVCMLVMRLGTVRPTLLIGTVISLIGSLKTAMSALMLGIKIQKDSYANF